MERLRFGLTRRFRLGMGILVLGAFSAGVIGTPPVSAADPERDPFLSHVSAGALISGFEEQFNPYSGQFVARFLTASLAGKGGLNINVYLYYSTEVWNRTDLGTLHSASLDTSDHAGGAGWQLHMGKVINPAGAGSADATSPDNPLLIMPDGSTRLLYQSSEFPGEMITEDRWRYRFDASIPGWELTTTDGTVYLFQTLIGPLASTMSGVAIAQCTKVTDVNGNAITIEYEAPGKVKKITGTYGRTVEFTYTTFDRIQFIRVKSGPTTLQQWEIKYGTALLTWTHLIGDRTVYAVRELVPPEGDPWKFTTNSASISKAAGAAMLKRIELPTGGIVEYTYSGVDYDVGCQTGTKVERASLSQRKELGRAVTSATYSYSYSNPGKSNAVTTISGPLGYVETHDLIGFGSFQQTDPSLFKIGRNQSKTTTDGLQTVTEAFTWSEGDTISSNFRVTSAWTNCISSRAMSPVKFVKPQTVTRTVTRDGVNRTTTSSSFDQYGNPALVTELGEVSRSTSFNYFYSTANNILDARPTLIDRSPGGIERRWYDSFGRLDRVNLNPSTSASENGVDMSYSYDSFGNLTSAVTENGTQDRETRFLNYSFGQPERDEYENGSSDVRVNRDITALGLVNWQEDGREGTAYRTSYTYDNLGRRTSIDPPVGLTTSISYANDGSTATVTRGNRTEQYIFDGFGRWTSWLDVERGDRRDRSYDALGRLTQESFFRGGVAADQHSYDALGRLTQVLHPDGTSINYSYSGNTVTATDELNNSTVFSYEAFGDPDEKRLKQVADAENGIWSYGYESTYGQLASIDAPGSGAERSFSYQSTGGFLATETHPEVSGNTSYSYSPAGDSTQRSRGGLTVSYEYDRLGRLTKVNPGGTAHDVFLEYTGLDLETEVRNSSAQHNLTYDGSQRLLSRSTFISAISSKIATYAYDDHDRLTRIIYPSGRRVDYTYDTKGRLTSALASGEQHYLTTVSYTTAGDVASTIFGNGVSTSWSYDTRFRPTLIAAGSHSLTISYDNASNVTQWISDGAPRSFGYDDLHRLTSASGPASESVTYTYKPTGDRETRTIDGVLELYGYNSSQQLTIVDEGVDFRVYGYDASGRLITADASTFTYTPLDELATTTTPSRSFTYDGRGLRASRSDGGTTTYFIRDAQGRVIAEYDQGGTLLREHVYALGRRIATALPSGDRFYFQHDGQGSVWIVTDENGQEVQPAQIYWPFGLAVELGSTEPAAPGSSEAITRSLRAIWGAAAATPSASSPGPRTNSGSLFADGFEGGCYSAWSRAVPNECGDGLVFAPEQCETGCFGPVDCESLGFDGGTLGCDSCALDTEACHVCNDGIVEGPELCDLTDLSGQDCQSQGYFTGVLSCASDCTFDVSGCHNCGNNQIDSGETCDGTDLGGESCMSRGLTGGDLACSSGCVWDLSGCYTCGNGIVEPPEQCDLSNLNSQSCGHLGYVGGDLACSGSCMFDDSGCHNCGNNVIDAGETCDGSDLGGLDCQALGFDAGTLECQVGCDGLDPSGCFDYPDEAAPRFTGKELEEGLDWYYLGARYLDAPAGRFGVPDPGPMHLANPQSFNRYAYSINNPYKYDDPDGRVVDTVLDAGFVAYDVYDIGSSVIRGEGVSGGQLGSLGGNLLGLAVPGLTGGGKIIEGLMGSRAVRALARMARSTKRSLGVRSALVARRVGGFSPLQKVFEFRLQKGNFLLGELSSEHAAQLGRAFVGDDAVEIVSDGVVIGFRSADGLRVFRSPKLKSRGRAAGTVQANLEEFTVDAAGRKTLVRNGHIDIID